MHDAEILHLLACPGCGGALVGRPAGVSCGSCGRLVPQVAGVLCLLDEYDTHQATWRSQHARARSDFERTASALEAHARLPSLMESTRRRLSAQALLARELAAELDAIYPRELHGEGVAPEEGTATLASKRHLLHRDWGWSDSPENGAALAFVERSITAPLGSALVFGAGACRLAYDLHQRHATTTIALDNDPFLLAIAKRVISGESIEFIESWANTIDLESMRAPGCLRAPAAVRGGFDVVISDALEPSLRSGAFDSIVTPWFIDVGPSDLRVLIAVMHGLLRPGGQWINFGPLSYPPTRHPACRYMLGEILDFTNRVGFVVGPVHDAELVYSYAPLAHRGQLERCITFAARKNEE